MIATRLTAIANRENSGRRRTGMLRAEELAEANCKSVWTTPAKDAWTRKAPGTNSMVDASGSNT